MLDKFCPSFLFSSSYNATRLCFMRSEEQSLGNMSEIKFDADSFVVVSDVKILASSRRHSSCVDFTLSLIYLLHYKDIKAGMCVYHLSLQPMPPLSMNTLNSCSEVT